MIVASHVMKYYGTAKAVDDISFEVKEGENMILLGTSGCGKTTTLKMINRLIPMSSGTIQVNGKNINEQPAELLRRSIGYVLQHNSLFPHRTVAENIAIVPELLGWDKKKIRTRTEDLASKLHLPTGDFLDAYPNELSGGQQQRVNIARALAADPPILLMDEPFGALDNITRGSISKEFLGLDELKRKTIVLVTHDVREAFMLGDNICIMDKGRVMQQGTAADLVFHPANDFVKDFLSSSYLELVLATITAADVWDKLGALELVPANEHTLPFTSSLWDMMEAASKQAEGGNIFLYNRENNTVQVGKENIARVVASVI